jgi:hypothetical protein
MDLECRSCLAGTALFSKLAMQLLLDKLAASGGEMKVSRIESDLFSGTAES